jgi:hypothetical protein
VVDFGDMATLCWIQRVYRYREYRRRDVFCQSYAGSYEMQREGDVYEIGAMGSELGQRRRWEFSVQVQEHDGKDFREESDCTWPFNRDSYLEAIFLGNKSTRTAHGFT